jgi:hypothetical protein
MFSLGDSFAWPFQDGSWLSKILLQGLILLIVIIPIVGWIIAPIALSGWLLVSLDNIRAGRPELAPAGFHLRRGIPLFGVALIYVLVIAIPTAILSVLGALLTNQSAGGGGALFGLAYLYQGVASLFLLFLYPSIVVSTWRGGFSAGMDVSGVWRRATANPTNSILAALVFLAANFIGSLGFIVCFVGVLFTTVYAYAVMAGAAAWLDQVSAGDQPATSPTGPTY